MIKKYIKKDYLGDGLLTHVFLGGVWSGFMTRKSDFLMVFGLKFGQSAADSLEVLMKTSIQQTLTWGVPPLPSPPLSLKPYITGLVHWIAQKQQKKSYIVCAKASKTTLDPRWQTKFTITADLKLLIRLGKWPKSHWKPLNLRSTDLKK